ncbi:MAG: hypothetical protein AB7T27_04910 [Kiritimatiellia bacterium]
MAENEITELEVKEELVAVRAGRPNMDCNLFLQLLVGVVGTAAVSYGVLPLKGKPGMLDYTYAIIWERGPVQFLELYMFFMVATFLILKSRIVRAQSKVISSSPVNPSIDLTDDDQVQELRNEVSSHPKFSMSILLSRINRILMLWLGSKDISRVSSWNSTESGNDQGGAESTYSIVNVLVWAIPIMGFIGTVQGLGFAVSGFADFLSGAGDLGSIKTAIGNVTAGLGMAFDTTLLALILVSFLMFPLASIQRKESDFFGEIDNYIDDMLLSRFPSQGQQPIVIENLEDSIEAAFRRYIPDPDRYDEVFTRSIDKAANMVEGRFSGLAKNYEGTLNALADRLQNSVAGAGDALKGAISGVVENIDKSSQKSTEAALQLTAKMAEVGKLASGIQDMLKLQASIEQGLKGISAADEFQKTLGNIREHLTVTDQFCKQLSKPRVITFKEEPVA